MEQQRRVLLGQLGANGDCVYATTVARQIKADFPNCRLTWAISSMCRQVIAHNPHVDDVWEVEMAGHSQMVGAWRRFAVEAGLRQRRGDFDDVFLTQIYPDNLCNFDGTVRSSIFRGYPRPITVPATPVIRLSSDEIEHVRAFAARHGLTPGGRAILFESSPRSGQSPMTATWVSEMALRIGKALPMCTLISASPHKGFSGDGVIDASELAFRHIAELARYCSLFVGCSSGITWLLTSDAAPLVPMIQVLSLEAGEYGAVVHDLERWGLPSGHVIELRSGGAARAADCAIDVLINGVAAVRACYHQELPPRFDYYLGLIVPQLRQGEVGTFMSSLGHTVARYGTLAVTKGLGRYLARRVAARVRRGHS